MENTIVKEYSRLAARYDSRWKFYVEAAIKKLDRKKPKRLESSVRYRMWQRVSLHYLSKNYLRVHLSGIDSVKEMPAAAWQRLPGYVNLWEE